MLSSKFLDKTCTIYTYTETISGGEQISTKSVLISQVPCDFYRGKKQRFQPTQLAQRTDEQRYTLILSPIAENVRKGMAVELSFGEFSDGEYIVDDVHMMYDHLFRLDHIECTCYSG